MPKLTDYVLVMIDRADGEETRITDEKAMRKSIQAGADFNNLSMDVAIATLMDGQVLRTFGYIRKLEKKPCPTPPV